MYLIILLSIFWIINSGIFHLFLIICGLISIISTYYIYSFIIKITNLEFKLNLSINYKTISIKYFIRTIFDVIKSSLLLIKNIVINREPDASIIELDINNHIMILAHSITITPGSITIFQKSNNKILVHCLYPEIADDIRSQAGIKKIIDILQYK